MADRSTSYDDHVVKEFEAFWSEKGEEIVWQHWVQLYGDFVDDNVPGNPDAENGSSGNDPNKPEKEAEPEDSQPADSAAEAAEPSGQGEAAWGSVPVSSGAWGSSSTWSSAPGPEGTTWSGPEMTTRSGPEVMSWGSVTKPADAWGSSAETQNPTTIDHWSQNSDRDPVELEQTQDEKV
jgi:hypothetical protein